MTQDQALETLLLAAGYRFPEMVPAEVAQALSHAALSYAQTLQQGDASDPMVPEILAAWKKAQTWAAICPEGITLEASRRTMMRAMAIYNLTALAESISVQPDSLHQQEDDREEFMVTEIAGVFAPDVDHVESAIEAIASTPLVEVKTSHLMETVRPPEPKPLNKPAIDRELQAYVREEDEELESFVGELREVRSDSWIPALEKELKTPAPVEYGKVDPSVFAPRRAQRIDRIQSALGKALNRTLEETPYTKTPSKLSGVLYLENPEFKTVQEIPVDVELNPIKEADQPPMLRTPPPRLPPPLTKPVFVLNKLIDRRAGLKEGQRVLTYSTAKDSPQPRFGFKVGDLVFDREMSEFYEIQKIVPGGYRIQFLVQKAKEDSHG